MNKSVNFEPLSPLLFLNRAASFYPNKIAVVKDGFIISYAEFYDACFQFAQFMIQHGIRPNDKVAFLSKNCPKLLMAFYAVPICQAALVPINFRLIESEVGYILNNSTAKLFFIEKEFFHDSYLESKAKVIILEDLEMNQIEQVILQKSISLALPRDESATISINYTSGTTGVPKGVEYSHRGAYLNALGECITAGLGPNTKYLWTLPMFHCNGWCFTWAVTASLGSHIFIDNNSPQTIIDAISAHGITHMCAAPTVLNMIASSPLYNNFRPKQPLKIITAGSAPAPEIIYSFQQKDIEIIHVYGLTESYGPHISSKEICQSAKNLNKCLANLTSLQGMPSLNGIFARVVDKKMHDVPHDGKTLGEVLLRGNNIMKGYFKDPKETNKAFSGGWFHTGDLAVIHPNRAIEIKDREKDIIISGGENISSIEVERVIQEMKGILHVAVIAKSDDLWGEIVHAIVEPIEGISLLEEEVIRHCKARLPGFKCPKYVSFRKMPLNSTGKIQKNLLYNF